MPPYDKPGVCEASLERDYVIASLRTLELTLTHDPLIPLHRGNTLVITLDGLRYECTTNDPVELLSQVNVFLTRYDPDLPQALEILCEAWEQFSRGRIPSVQLLVEKTVRCDLEAYQVDTAAALRLRQLRESGIHLHPGERAFPRLGPDAGIDMAQYQAILPDAALELLVPFGYDEAKLRNAMKRG